MSDEQEKDWLDGMGSEESEAEEVEEVAETPEPETPEPEKGEPEKAEVPEAPPAPEPESGHVPLAALKAEREKRQRLEKELEEFRQQPRKAEDAPKPDFYQDPEKYVETVAQTVQQRMQGQFYAVLESEMREAAPDYDEAMDFLDTKVAENPMLRQQIFSQPNPARAAYKLAKQLQEMEQMKDPESYRQKLEAEIRQKVEAEFKAKAEAEAKKRADIPPDLASDRSARDSAGRFATDDKAVFSELFDPKE